MILGNRLHIDGALFFGIVMLLGVGLFVVFSASGKDWDLLQRNGIRILVSLVALLLAAQVPPDALQRWSPYVFFVGMGA